MLSVHDFGRSARAAKMLKESMERDFGTDIPYEQLQGGGLFGPRFRGVFFFQNVYWRVVIPIIYGTTAVKPFDALQTMSPVLKQRLLSQPDRVREYLLLWADCIDYDTGYLQSKEVVATGSFAAEMIDSTERELTSAITDLCQQRPNSNAMHSARDATEKALKAYLAHHASLSHSRAQKYFGHKLDLLVQEVELHAPHSALVELRKDLDAYAAYNERYSSNAYTRAQLWRAYRLGQYAAAEMLRTITGRNQRSVVKSHPIFAGGRT